MALLQLNNVNTGTLLQFTLDSATEFLLGIDAHTLSTSLSYPPSSAASRSNTPTSGHITAERAFAEAFAKAQTVTADRQFFGALWPLWEFWEDKTAEPMKIVDSFILPIIERALRKKRTSDDGFGAKATRKATLGDVSEDDTLLEHLLSLSDGRRYSPSTS